MDDLLNDIANKSHNSTVIRRGSCRDSENDNLKESKFELVSNSDK